MKNTISQRLKEVRDRISSVCARVNRVPSEVKLVVVTKAAAEEAVKEVIRQGEIELGENRVQRLSKISSQISDFLQSNNANEKLPAKVNWHMIGHLQRNKVRGVLPIASLIHSVDTLRLAEQINSSAGKLELRPKVLMQVNTSEEAQKYGVPVGAAVYLAEQLFTMPNLELVGLMTMAPLTRDKNAVRDCFVRARELFVELKGEQMAGASFKELSMGMSADYEMAVEEGATIIRVGSAIFAG